MEALAKQVQETVRVLAARWGYPRARTVVRRLILEAFGHRRRMLGEVRRRRRRA